MICPVCKKEIPSDSVLCPECGSRIGLVCHNCKTVNPVNSLKCKNCGAEILKLCPECRTINLPTAKRCRKCGFEFQTSENLAENTDYMRKETVEIPKIRPTRPEIAELIYNTITDDEKSIISLTGAKAMGKDYIVNKVLPRLDGYLVIKGTGSPVSQLTAGGFLQELLLSFFGLPNFCIVNTQFEKDAVKFFKHTFPSLSNEEILRFINFLYPHKTGSYEEILENKVKTFALMQKIFLALCSDRKVLIIMDNFDYIDALSFEFFNNFIRGENVLNNVKLLLTYSENRPAQSYFYLEPEKYGNIYLNLDIAPMTPVEAVDVFKSVTGINKLLPDIEKKELFKKSNGNPAYIKSGIQLKQECLTYGFDYKLPLSFEELLKKRLEILKIFNPLAFDMLTCASIIGKKINSNLLREVFEANDSVYDKAVEVLVKGGYWIKTGDFFYEFENSYLWEVVFTMAKSQPGFIELNKKLYSILHAFTLSSNTLLAIILQNMQNKRDAFDVWTQNVNLASYIGDINLYVISQKQCLALINEFDDVDTLNIRFNISERIGKILTQYNPSDAVDFLPDAISNAQGIGDSIKEIELLSYMTQSCKKTGEYFGVVESTDRVLDKIKPEKALETALVKAVKLDALLAIGNCGEVINIVTNEILPVFNKYMNGVYKRKDIPWELLFDFRLKTYLILANAYAFQGNKKAFEIMALIFNMIERGQVKDENVIVKSHLIYALLNTVCGDYSMSNRHLQEIMDAETKVVLNNENILNWNFINLINRFLNKEYEHIQEDLFEIVAFANNNHNEFIKNAMKTLLGKVLIDNNQYPKGLEIYNEQLEYFSNSKIALGALLCWYLISDTIMVTDSPESAIDIAQKALKVAESPKIDNYNFQIYLKMALAKAYIIESDFDTARIHLDEALKISLDNELHDLTSRLYLTYGRLYQDVGFKKSSKQIEFLKMANTMFERSMKYVRRTQNNYLFRELTKSQKVLKSFCDMNKIQLNEK